MSKKVTSFRADHDVRKELDRRFDYGDMGDGINEAIRIAYMGKSAGGDSGTGGGGKPKGGGGKQGDKGTIQNSDLSPNGSEPPGSEASTPPPTPPQAPSVPEPPVSSGRDADDDPPSGGTTNSDGASGSSESPETSETDTSSVNGLRRIIRRRSP